ncbi:MAG: transcription antitermination factor NusB [Actinomycetes bacterium]
MSTSARKVAYDVVHSVHVNDAYANLELPSACSRANLTTRDAAFATELTYGTLRRQGSLDAVISACANRGDLDAPVQDILRIGAYQLLFLRTPAHAAINEAVSLVGKEVGRSATGFVNAVLRRVSEKTWEQWSEQLTAGLSDVDRLAIEYSYPVWVIRALADAYGCNAQTIVPILEVGNDPANVTLVARPGQSEVSELLDLPHVAPGRWSPLAVQLVRSNDIEKPWSSNPADIELVQTNQAGVQDEGSQLVALALVNAVVEGEEHDWLDMCSGPGGKAAIMAGYAAEKNIVFTALEPNESRAKLVENALWNAPGDPRVLVTDARDYAPAVSFDRILVDAPCTGLGALRRRPESRWRKQPSDIRALSALQGELLVKAAELVRIGGLVAYATCSPHIAETDVIVDSFLVKHPDFSLEPLEPLLPMLELPSETTKLRLRPDIHGTDGMYLAIFRRNA